MDIKEKSPYVELMEDLSVAVALMACSGIFGLVFALAYAGLKAVA